MLVRPGWLFAIDILPYLANVPTNALRRPW